MSRRPPIEIPNVRADEGPAFRYWGNQKPPKNALFLCQATPRVSPDSTKATIRMYGPIDPYGGIWGTSAKEVAEALDGLAETVTELQLRINSPGGSCFEGMAILNLLRAHPVNVTAVVDGLAASAASFIAAGCDQTIMSPGTQMMIHGPSGLCWGTSADMHETADVLDKIAASMASLYVEAAGGKLADWLDLMQTDTWYTAEEAVEAKLADSIAVVPDAGQTTTAGAGDDDEDDEDLDPVELDDPEALTRRYAAMYDHAAAAGVAPAHRKPPTASAGGSTPPKGAAVVDLNDQQIAALRKQVGFAEDADADTIVAAVAEALAETAETPIAPSVPTGMTLIESDVLAELREGATAGRAARDQLDAQARDTAINAAIEQGKITPARRDHWTAAWAADAEGARATLDALAPGLVVPTAELGTVTEPDGEQLDPQTIAGLDAYAQTMGIPKEALHG